MLDILCLYQDLGPLKLSHFVTAIVYFSAVCQALRKWRYCLLPPLVSLPEAHFMGRVSFRPRPQENERSQLFWASRSRVRGWWQRLILGCWRPRDQTHIGLMCVVPFGDANGGKCNGWWLPKRFTVKTPDGANYKNYAKNRLYVYLNKLLLFPFKIFIKMFLKSIHITHITCGLNLEGRLFRLPVLLGCKWEKKVPNRVTFWQKMGEMWKKE